MPCASLPAIALLAACFTPAMQLPVTVDQAPVDVHVTVGVPDQPSLQVATHLSFTRLVAEQLKALALTGMIVGLVAHTAATATTDTTPRRQNTAQITRIVALSSLSH